MANAIITCRLCARRFDKGVPADETQDDSLFVCGECALVAGGYPQNGWINPLVLRPDTKLHTEVEAEEAKPGFFARLFGKKG